MKCQQNLDDETVIKQISIDSYVKRITRREGEKSVDIFLNELKTCEPEKRALWIDYLQQFGKRENKDITNALKPFLYQKNKNIKNKNIITILYRSIVLFFRKRGSIEEAIDFFAEELQPILYEEDLIKETLRALAKVGDATVFDDLISLLKSRKYKRYHNEVKKALGEIGATVTEAQELEKVRQVLWQTRFEGDPEISWVAYQQVVARLTELQVDELTQKEPLWLSPPPSPALPPAVSRLAHLKGYTRYVVDLLVSLILAILVDTLISLLSQEFQLYLPQNPIRLALLFTAVLPLTAVSRWLNPPNS